MHYPTPLHLPALLTPCTVRVAQARRAEAARAERLALMAEAGCEPVRDGAPVPSNRRHDMSGRLRLECLGCDECAGGYVLPEFRFGSAHGAQNQQLFMYCARCGCSCLEHGSPDPEADDTRM